MVAEFGAFATRMTAALSGLAWLLTGDRDAAATLVHTALTRVSADRIPDVRRAVAALVHAWLAGAPPVGEPEELPDDLELLRSGLDALPDTQRVAVVLHHWSGLPVSEIAAVLRRPEQAVAADLAVGVAGLHVAPESSTVDVRLAALVAAAGPPPVDVTGVVAAGRAQRRQRRRTAVAAAGVLLAAGTVAALLTGGEPIPAPAERTPVRFEESDAAVASRARRMTEELAVAMADFLPAGVPLPEFAANSADDPHRTYVANAGFGRTKLIFMVGFRAAEAFVPCADPGQDCRYRQFPDDTVAEVVVKAEVDRIALSLTARRPDGTAFHVLAYGIGPPELTVEDMFGLSTVVTY